MKILLVGRGAWSKIYQKTIQDFPEIELTICGKDWIDHCDRQWDGVIVCTPPDTHVEIASYFLAKNIPCIIEKPLALSYEDAVKLKQFDTSLIVNNIHLFSNDFQKIKLKYNDNIVTVWSNGGNDGPVRSYSSLYDYGWHEISKGLSILGTNNIEVSECVPFIKNDKVKFRYDITVNYIILEGYFGNGFDNKIQNTKIFYDDPEDAGLKARFSEYNPLLSDENPKPLYNVISLFIKIITENFKYSNLDFSLEVQKVLDECYRIAQANLKV